MKFCPKAEVGGKIQINQQWLKILNIFSQRWCTKWNDSFKARQGATTINTDSRYLLPITFSD